MKTAHASEYLNGARDVYLPISWLEGVVFAREWSVAEACLGLRLGGPGGYSGQMTALSQLQKVVWVKKSAEEHNFHRKVVDGSAAGPSAHWMQESHLSFHPNVVL